MSVGFVDCHSSGADSTSDMRIRGGFAMVIDGVELSGRGCRTLL